MSQSSKPELWKKLKEAGVMPPRHYREYTAEQLALAVQQLQELPAPGDSSPQTAPPALESASSEVAIPVSTKGDEVAGLRMNTHRPDEPLRYDPETGFTWYVDEVRKSAFPKPRGRRVLRYNDPGVRTVQVRDSNHATESFEMPGDRVQQAEARITLPSYQVGQYADPRYPFKIHVYNGLRGFDLFEVEDFYGGADMVPATVKRIYVSSTLCYDIMSVVRAVEAEARRLQINPNAPLNLAQ